MERNYEPFAKFCYIFAPIIKCNLIHVLFGIVFGGSPWLLTEAHSIEVEIVGGYDFTGIITIIFRNDSKVTHRGYLCDDESWNYKTGEVLCKHAGHIGVHEVLHDVESKYGPHKSDSYLHGLACNGDEGSLTECRHTSWSQQRCAALAGVKCRSDKNRHQSGFYGSFIARMIMSTMFVPACTLFCVLCRCCHRHFHERRRLNTRESRFSHHASRARTHEVELGTFPTMMASPDSSAGLPSYDQIIKDKFNTFKKVPSVNRKDEDETEEPPPAYETVIGTWTAENRTSVT